MAIGEPKPPLVVIAGPTASGKSALALVLAAAEQPGGVIVNADATQLYRDLPILSAAPSGEERARVDHRLFGFRDGAQPCSAPDWAALASAEIADIHAGGRTPVVVGGTGLYLRTLLDGIAPIPPINPAIRAQVRSRDVAANHAELDRLDPQAAARLGPADTARIARALEVVLSTGRLLRDWQEERAGGIGDEVTLRAAVLLPPRDWLYTRCDERFAAMVDGGAVEEVEALLARGLDPALPVMRAIGVGEIAAMLAGRASLAETLAAGQQATRRYAKRQYTWFARQPPADWPRYCEVPDRAALELLAPRS
ncbi:MAG: tRNA (adenosine(37)-N6)-dimethylallyltransferase MiaA [Sphingomicrobium sp.]